jgi:hypothetical protein
LVGIAPVDFELYVSELRCGLHQKVMLDADLAILYEVQTKVFNQAVWRNSERFPEDFMFQLTQEEAAALRSQIVTLEKDEAGMRNTPR